MKNILEYIEEIEINTIPEIIGDIEVEHPGMRGIDIKRNQWMNF